MLVKVDFLVLFVLMMMMCMGVIIGKKVRVCIVFEVCGWVGICSGKKWIVGEFVY